MAAIEGVNVLINISIKVINTSFLWFCFCSCDPIVSSVSLLFSFCILDVSDKVVIYGSISTRMKLPDIGAWVLVRITAIYDPSHFWVQLPFGVENLTDQIIKCKL